MIGADGQTIIAGTKLKLTQLPLGSQGWNTVGGATRDGRFAGIAFDVTPLFVRDMWAPGAEFEPAIVPGKAPSRLLGSFTDGQILPGNTYGGIGLGFGGSGSDRCYYLTNDGLYVSANFDTSRTFTATALINLNLDANTQRHTREWNTKIATDPINKDICFAHVGEIGLYRTADGGTTMPELTWLPRPVPITTGWDPQSRWGVVTVDELGSNIGSGPTLRKGRGAACPAGRGIYLWTDGGVSGTKITTNSGPGNFTSVSDMKFLSNGKLICTVVDTQTMEYDATISTATGGGGIGSDNVRLYDPAASGEKWSIVNHGANTQVFSSFFTSIGLDSRYPGVGYFLEAASNEFAHTADGTTFIYTGMGNGDSTNGVFLHPFTRTRPTSRPAMAARFRFGGLAFANSGLTMVADYTGQPNPTTGVSGPHIIAHTGLGPLLTPLNNWPTQSSVTGVDPLSPTKQPLWDEICAKAEAKVGQAPTFDGDTIWNGAQDISISKGERGERGHLACVETFPPIGFLSDADHVAHGPIKGFCLVYRQRLGQAAVQGVSFKTATTGWALAPHQSVAGAAAYEPGCIAGGKNYSAVILPGWSQNSEIGHVPVYWSDIRSAFPVPITFKKENGTVVPMIFNQDPNDMSRPMSYNGFHAAYFSNPSRKVCVDPDHPGRYYFWNVGGATNVDRADTNGPTTWTYDPPQYGGIYMMDIDAVGFDPANPVATRVYSAFAETGHGSPCYMGNFGVYDTQMAIAGGHMMLASNYLWSGPSAESSQRIVVIRLSDMQRRVLTTGPGNVIGSSLGDPLYGTTPCLWAAGYWNGIFGAAVSHDWTSGTTPSWQGTSPGVPFDVTMPNGGTIGHMEAQLAVEDEAKRFGKLAFSIRTRGLVYGELQLGGN